MTNSVLERRLPFHARLNELADEVNITWVQLSQKTGIQRGKICRLRHPDYVKRNKGDVTLHLIEKIANPLGLVPIVFFDLQLGVFESAGYDWYKQNLEHPHIWGDFLKHKRGKREEKEMARVCGVPYTTYYAYERGTRPPLTKLEEICARLETVPFYLMHLQQWNPRKPNGSRH